MPLHKTFEEYRMGKLRSFHTGELLTTLSTQERPATWWSLIFAVQGQIKNKPQMRLILQSQLNLQRTHFWKGPKPDAADKSPKQQCCFLCQDSVLLSNSPLQCQLRLQFPLSALPRTEQEGCSRWGLGRQMAVQESLHGQRFLFSKLRKKKTIIQ